MRCYCPLLPAATINFNGWQKQPTSPQSHRVVAALAHDHSAGEGLVADLDAERPFFAVESVFLDEVKVVHSGNLEEWGEKCNFIVKQSSASALASLKKNKTSCLMELNPIHFCFADLGLQLLLLSLISALKPPVFTLLPTNKHFEKQLHVSARCSSVFM